MLTCDIDERWNGPPPKCEPIQCEILPETYRGGKIFTPNGTYYSMRAELVCPRGFRVDGPRYIRCTSTGQWSEPFLGCKGKLNAHAHGLLSNYLFFPLSLSHSHKAEDVLQIAPTTQIPVTQFTRSRPTTLPPSATSTSSRRPIVSTIFSTSTPQSRLSTITTTIPKVNLNLSNRQSTPISTFASPSPFAPTITVHGNKGVTNNKDQGRTFWVKKK